MGKGGDASIRQKTKHRVDQNNQNDQNDKLMKKTYTLSEVQQHRTPDDAWTIYNNKVYDVSDWFDHPGGAVIFTHAGADMTDIFTAFHAPGSHKMLKKFYIGDLQPESLNKSKRQLEFEKGYRDLRSKLIRMGLFEANVGIYAFRCFFYMCMWAVSVALVAFSDNVFLHFLSAINIGLFMQQCAWMSHDFVHNQVFRTRRYGDYVGLWFGNVMQGYSVQWWKNKHNCHHAVTNLHSSSALAQDGDPDIDTMPLIAWSLKQAQSFRELSADGKDSPFVKFFVRHQAVFYLPILMLARLSWMNESFKCAFHCGAASENLRMERERKGLTYPIMEKIGILIHYAWVFALSSGFGQFSFIYGLWYFMTITTSCGFFLGIVFGLGHNGMATYDADERPDFWSLQVTASRNIIPGRGFSQIFLELFFQGLQYQIEHHLFPTLPYHNLQQAHVLVENFCKKMGHAISSSGCCYRYNRSNKTLIQYFR